MSSNLFWPIRQQQFRRINPEDWDRGLPRVIIATLFKQSVLTLTQRLDQKGIPYILIDSFIDHTNCISYYGTHSYDSGYIAGRLLFEQIRQGDDLVIFRFTRKGIHVLRKCRNERKDSGIISPTPHSRERFICCMCTQMIRRRIRGYWILSSRNILK